MKIQVNKNQQAINFKRHVGTTITIAKQKAQNGITRFDYTKPTNQGIDTYSLIEAVENETEETVYGGYKCIKDGLIIFSIREY